MKTVSSEIVIDRPVRTVYDQWTQFETYPSFMSGVKEVRQLDDERLYWLVEIGGVERGFEASITEQRPDALITWRSTSGPENVGAVTFTALDASRTRVELRLDWEPEGLVEHVGAVMQADQSQVSADLERFRDLIESNGFASGAWRGKIVAGEAQDDGAHGRTASPDPEGRFGATPADRRGDSSDGPLGG